MNQKDELELLLKENSIIQNILELTPKLNMPNWYLGAGCISQTVWNILHEYEPTRGIKDYDLVYYDKSDISYNGEDKYIKKGKKLFKDISAKVEIINEARVHLWYEKRFGKKIKQYKSVEDAISSWPTTVTTISVRYNDNRLEIFAHHGLDDLFNMIVRPNKVQVSKERYTKKANRWKKNWPKLTIIKW